MTDKYTEAEITELARELKEYLKAHSSAADTLEGIATRWQMASGQMVEQRKLQAVLEQLCDEGWVRKRNMHGGNVLYVPCVDDK
ncbi:hypothetical protein P886_1702 [Alteromonadaceae bacterium 2753L.S.0a.02]|nr:hypothetical protein P886_1702 [Alteromonadaceae bacterium 2753L.S.0a.02]